MASCNPNRTDDGHDYQVGWLRIPSGYQPRAVYADIKNYNPYMKSGSANTTAWVMLNLYPGWWAQVGWYKESSGTRQNFYDWTDTQAHGNIGFFAADTVGSYPTYKVSDRTSPGSFQFFHNGALIWTVAEKFTPARGAIYGETHTLANQMPGGSNFVSYGEDFTNAHIFFASSNQVFDGTTYGNTTYFDYNKVSTTETYIWDKACTQ